MGTESSQKILEAAKTLFSRKGYTAVRTREIAEEAGVNEVTLFRIFGSKREVYHETFRKYIVRPTEEYLLGGTTGDTDSDLRRTGNSISELFIRNSSLIKMSIRAIAGFEEIAAELESQPEQMIRIMAGYFRRIAGSSWLNKTPERLARHFVTSILGTTVHYIHHPEYEKKYPLKEWLDDFTDNFIAGIDVEPGINPEPGAQPPHP